MRTRGRGGGRGAQRSAAGVAPVELGIRRRSSTVARRVDHVMRTIGESRNRFAVTDFVLGGEEVRGVDAEAPRVTDASLIQPGGHVLGTAPTQVTRVDVHGRVRILRQRVDGVMNQIEPFLALITREAVGHGERIGFDDDRHPRGAHSAGDAVDPAPVVGARPHAARCEAAAVAMGDSIDRQHRDGAGGGRVADVLPDRCCGTARDDPVCLRRIGDRGQLGTRRIGALGGAHGRRRGVDVERRPVQWVAIGGQTHRRGGTDRHRVADKTDAGDGRDRQEGSDPSCDCTSS